MKDTQQNKILSHLLSGRKINPIQAINLFGCTKLSTRIGELERDPDIAIKVRRDNVTVKTRYGKTVVKQYYLPMCERILYRTRRMKLNFLK